MPSLRAMASLRPRTKSDSISQRDGISKNVSEQFRRFFLRYALAINKQEGRTGSLFQKNFKRLAVTNHSYFVNLVYYIHANPQYHRITEDFRSYLYSSYLKFLIAKRSKLKKAEILGWFGSVEQYQIFHNMAKNERNWDEFKIED